MTNPLERLRHHVSGAIARGEKEVIAEQRPYFCEGSEAMLALEGMVDRVGLRNVLFALGHICHAKAQHLEENWQDQSSAKVWENQASFFEDHATTIRFADS